MKRINKHRIDFKATAFLLLLAIPALSSLEENLELCINLPSQHKFQLVMC
jgi:hypothetical protein